MKGNPGNTTNHPPHRGRPITPHKGGRTIRRTIALTPEEDKLLVSKAKALGISLNDCIVQALQRL